MKILVFGTFDLLHPGHRFVLNEASLRGELHVVVARNVTVEKIKSKAPRQSETERMQTIQDAYPDAIIYLGDADDYLKIPREIDPDLILLGYDQKMPPGITENNLPGKTERLEAFEPEKYKSSLKT